MNLMSSLNTLIASSVCGHAGFTGLTFVLEYTGPPLFKYLNQSNINSWKLWILMEW